MKSQVSNIFEILSAADKELVLSAMLKFFIQNEYLSKSFLSFLDSPLTSKGDTELEKSCSFLDKNSNKRKLRLDLLVTESSNKAKLVLVIENKFKAIPTAGQLALYDEYFLSVNQIAVKKVLFVFSFEQIAFDVNEYCEKNNWTIRSYLPEIILGNKTKAHNLNNLIEWLDSKLSMNVFDEKSKLLLADYLSYLLGYKDAIRKYIDSPVFCLYNTNDDRFNYFQYLLFIQTRISERLYKLGFNNITTSNDGGKNIIPSIAFWHPVNNLKLPGITSTYSGIDGSTFKLGVLYDKRKHAELSKNVEFLIGIFNTKFESIRAKPNNRSFKKSDEDKKSESVHSIYTFEILDKQPLDLVIDDIVKASMVYFNKVKNANSF